MTAEYCNSLNRYSRFKTREVLIGNVPMGGDHPIRIQSMTTTDTMDTMATVEQTIRMVDAGCEYVRITAPSIKEANNLVHIKTELLKRGYTVPLVADIHFTPNAAEVAARIVEKVRVNPGNYVDKKKFDQLTYTDAEYAEELIRIEKRFLPLVHICKEHGTAMRIGTNHGSLSDRIMSRYGDTPMGMVESAMEFIRICAAADFHNLVISMKASNTKVMVQAYRLLVKTMITEGMNYPLHLGVTEAGDGEDGRIKSAVGIGALLEDGLGDTIRVSLTEEPEAEIPVAAALARRYEKRGAVYADRPIDSFLEQYTAPKSFDPYTYNRRKTRSVMNIGGHHAPVVMIDLSETVLKDPAMLSQLGYTYSPLLDKYLMSDQAADFTFLGDNIPSFVFPGNLLQVYYWDVWTELHDKSNAKPAFALDSYFEESPRDSELNFLMLDEGDLLQMTDEEYILFQKALMEDKTLVVLLIPASEHGMAEQRRFFFDRMNENCDVPVLLMNDYDGLSEDELQLYAAADAGALLTDGFADGLFLMDKNASPAGMNRLSFGILQATRTRISKTEYISCPSCGRTLFDLQETTQKIRSRTEHLKGLKIGIMGCIVNGPGEMADADYGYVGAGPGVITLYKEKEVIKRNVPAEQAVDELVQLIKANGDWTEPAVIMN